MAAFNCYKRAFRINGFRLTDRNEYRRFNRRYNEFKEDIKDDVLHTFRSYRNEKQRLLEIKSDLNKQRRKVIKELGKIKPLGPVDTTQVVLKF